MKEAKWCREATECGCLILLLAAADEDKRKESITRKQVTDYATRRGSSQGTFKEISSGKRKRIRRKLLRAN